MRTSLKWLQSMVPGLTNDPQEFCDAMTLSGSKVEFYTIQNRDLDKIVIGQVKKIDKHPDADHLVICQVDVGDGQIQIVTGASNVSEGAKVPVVLDGGRVAGSHDGTRTEGGIRIKKGKLRGVESDGMMCSIEELGSSRDMFPDAPVNGLYILPDDAPVGADAVSYLGLDDVVIEYEITSNRVDCFSIIGLAREAAATFDLPFNPPSVKEVGSEGDVNDYISVDIENHELCRRYTARVVKNIHLAPSPVWMQQRLRSQGIRPINNIVDITNYVMEEFGQPMHAYDLDTIAGHRIIVKNASDKESFVTLDGKEHELDKDMLEICDGDKAVGLAGIMGGENSMITDDVKTMLFESACFDGTNIRLSAKRLGMRTEASGIFEKGLDPNNAILAMNRACDLIEELGAGEVVKGTVDIYPEPVAPWRVKFEPDHINAYLGTDIPADKQLSYLKKIELGYDEGTKELIIPTFRQDLLSFADISEEVARFYGYANIATTLPKTSATAGGKSEKMEIEDIARDVAEYCGFSQAYCYSFESRKVFDKLLLPDDAPERAAIEISNPLGEDFSIMRTLPLNGILTSLSTNYNRRNENVRLYELGNIYLADKLPLTELPDERMQFTLGCYGEGEDFYSIKGVVEEFLDKVGMTDRLTYDPSNKRPYLHPGRCADVIYDGERIGYLGELHPLVAANYDIKGRVYLAVIDMPYVVRFADFEKKYTGIANFPASTRDLSLVMKKSTLAGDVEKIFFAEGGDNLESVKLFDVYEGAQVADGYKSISYRLTFRAKDRSLSDQDVNQAMEDILTRLGEMGVELRR
ncbi:phenylalanine--tRNA ligase subunit beta [Candidatus Weimeria sp. HCP3S3_B5]|uniref:phenylalanine--tRNA ligase subunit beta n=1 Tax=Candidatus Weimeria sp. HCP3S3_B5 TaxID=3438871 RepID=UPI003F89816F